MLYYNIFKNFLSPFIKPPAVHGRTAGVELMFFLFCFLHRLRGLLRSNWPRLRNYRMKYRAIGAVAGFTVVEAYRKIGGLAGRFYGEIDDVGFAVGVKHFREFQRIGWDFGQIRSGGGNARRRKQSPSYLLANVGMGVGQVFRPFGIEVGENQHGGAGAADFGSHLGAGDSPRGPGVIGYVQQKRYKIFRKERWHFEEPVFDESHVAYHSTEDAVGFRRNDQGAVGGSELSEDGFGVGDKGLEFVQDGLGCSRGRP
jgi:hypothetical protein